ncbi:MAG TPA: hypothetical protein VLE72_02625 [Candidatus Saccharimonadales bacterium]|nr:hypothetical protein [Candidatus Saccharimonadales bacterium]
MFRVEFYKKAVFSLIITIGILLSLVASAGTARASNSRMIDDQIFNNTASMGVSSIQSFLNGFPNSCIKSYASIMPVAYYTYGGNAPAADIISWSASNWGVNPQVLLATMQKEEQLVDGSQGCDAWRFVSTMGYDCPGSLLSYPPGNYPTNNSGGTSPNYPSGISNTCVQHGTAIGFSAQVNHAAWLLEFGLQRSYGNTTWDGDDALTYYGPMTQGYRKRCGSCATIYYDGNNTINGQTIYIENGATASLYNYTPFLNQNFPTIFTNWFGNPLSACLSTGNLATTAGPKILSYKYGTTSTSFLTYTQLNNTGSACAEAHVWNPGFSTWLTHIAAGMRSSDPSIGTFVSSKSAVDMQASLNYLVYGGSGLLEVHRLSPNLRLMPGYYDVATNLSGVSPASGTFVAGDFFGRGYDQLVYVLYNGSNGRAEIHMFDPSMRSAIGYYDVPTNLGGVSATSGTFVAGDFLHIGHDQLAYILYAGGSGHAEVHVFDPSLRSAIGYYDVPTNLTAVSNATGTFVGGDFIGRGYSQLVYIIYNDSAGRVETHMFNPAMTQATGFQDVITNLTGFDPSQ